MAGRRPSLGWVLHAAACALPLLAVAGAADAQAGVLVRGLSGQARCSPGGEHTTIGGSCDAATDCEPGRACVNLEGVGSRCIDPQTEIVCVPGAGGCDGCPMNVTTGADPEECRVVVLAEGTYSLCLYSTSLVCLAENSFGFDALLCLPITENDPSIAEGDCDGDGAPNAEDTCLCEPGTGPSCSILPPLDGGSGELDASAPDAGARDASTPDAAARPDGSAPPSVLPEFRGGGGCACSAPRAASSGPGLLALLVASTLAAGRRRSSCRQGG